MYKLSLKRQLIIVFVLLFLFPLVFSLCIMDDYAGPLQTIVFSG